MIGGRDIIIHVSQTSEALDLAVRAVTRLWPNVVLENGVTGESFATYQEIPFAECREILAFRDKQSAAMWDELGPDPSLDGTLIHFLLANHELTIAIDSNPPPEITRFVSDLRRSLSQDIFTVMKEAA